MRQPTLMNRLQKTSRDYVINRKDQYFNSDIFLTLETIANINTS
jgi:hypothetical protein